MTDKKVDAEKLKCVWKYLTLGLTNNLQFESDARTYLEMNWVLQRGLECVCQHIPDLNDNRVDIRRPQYYMRLS